ncbi:ABC transporter permease subunit [Bradyrhizobium sp. CIR3A]|uniref:ABC transporter permease subunit n=1 Tax=Bradyrhizobium sp. CIR3A TaxID=2663838 RepID=UPI0017F9A314|nr:ATP-binding cassette domain-containing protein [Bradyrhizobium sp. CIR3A]MBB4264136.1 branched-subunit amino acid ABC-type transport system permease component/ABC-type branched-subunit amino acid transport system ATPase component [Bradyrhizobium sp. CIR3A]
MNALEIADLRAGYDASDVLHGMTLHVGAGERVGLFGPNGHGKTTLLNTISRVIRPRAGSVRFLGDTIDGLAPHRIVERGLIQVSQANWLFPDMLIMETLEMAAYTQRAREELKSNLPYVLELFPRLAERRRQQCKTLSGGERRMLSIGVGLMCAPRMLMLDEPNTRAFSEAKRRIGRGDWRHIVTRYSTFACRAGYCIYPFSGRSHVSCRSRRNQPRDKPRSGSRSSGNYGHVFWIGDALVSADSLSAVLVSGLVLGSGYALMASGLSLVWTTLGIFNFAYGALMTLGAYVAWTISNEAGLNLGLGAGISVSVAILIATGILVERSVVRPFYGHRDILLITVMTTLAVLIFIQKGVQLIWGARLKQIAPIVSGNVQLWRTTISGQETLIIVIVPFVLVALWLFLTYSRVGRGIRAVGQNPDAARLIGINVSRAFILTFVLSSVLAGMTGILLASIRLLTPDFGAEPLVKALIIVIFGGLGSLRGTIVAAYLMGIIEAALTFAVGIYWTPSVIFLLLIVTLVFRPQGLLGKVVR